VASLTAMAKVNKREVVTKTNVWDKRKRERDSLEDVQDYLTERKEKERGFHVLKLQVSEGNRLQTKSGLRPNSRI